MLQTHHIKNFQTHTGYTCHLNLTYQLFGQVLGTAPVVLVNHALTGNSAVTGDNGWWSDLIGKGKAIDTDCFTILAIDIPGNGYDGNASNLIRNYKQFNNSDIARTQFAVIQELKIEKLFAVIGGSLGGQIAWELAVQQSKLIEHLIPVATDWKATDWVIAQCHIQDNLLNNSLRPIPDARRHAMTFYRTPASFKQKFERSKKDDTLYNVQSWLNHHGNRLEERFSLSSYKLMNHLLLSADITAGVTTFNEVVRNITAQIHLVSIDTDGLFLADEIYEAHLELQKLKKNSTYHEITSIHGHDAFLIEYEQLEKIVAPIFQKQLCHK
ncbi:alpha/beta fold hydrolase [Dokdonia sinensis]|uniref:alpha/beta fold hydrolase n=1 Tax=Dokdonia sinensis TaxID=2479847 RepID=UPI00191C6B6A|nr:alpha/beta fold hydrolase [Dokdonia sinensis]